jgi:hypothetical protein
MNNLVLYVNDIELDLLPSTVVGLTKQVNDIAELKNRNADYTNQFKIPATARNVSAIDSVHVVPSVTRTPYRKLPAKLVVSGIENVGYIVINSVSKKYFECVFYSGNVNFFDLIKGKKLSDLDLSDAEHAWTLANVTASRLNEWDDGHYIYPIVDTVSNNNFFNTQLSLADWRALTPWLFIKYIFNKIFESVGFTAEGTFLESDRFKNLITNLEANHPQLNNIRWAANVNAVTAFPQNAGVEQNSNNIRFFNVIEDTNTQTHTLVVGNTNPNTFTFRPDFEGTYSFNLHINVVTNFPEKIARYEVCIYDATNPGTDLLRTVKTFVPGIDFVNHNFTLPIENIKMTADECMSVRMFFYPLTPATHHNQFFIQPDTFLRLTDSVYESVQPGLTWKIQENMYDMEQLEFIKAICQRFCLIPDTDSYINKVRFYQFGEIVNNIPIARDWSDKISKENKITFRDSSYARRNWLRYEQSEETPKELFYGDAAFDIDDEVLPNEKDILTLKFKSSKNIIRLKGKLVPVVQFHSETNPEVGVFANKVGARILMLNRDADTPDIGLTEYPAVLPMYVYSDNIPMAFFDNNSLDDLTWRSAIVTDYEDLVRVLQLYKCSFETMYLKAQDVSDFDFSIPVYIDRYSSYFYVNKISNWIDGKPTTVELIKIN